MSMAGHESIGVIRTAIELGALGIEIIAVLIILASVVSVVFSRGTARYLFYGSVPGVFESYKHQLGKGLLLGLELLVAADVVKTVTLDPTLRNVAVLGLLVVIRTFLSWCLAVEMNGRWPWQTGP